MLLLGHRLLQANIWGKISITNFLEIVSEKKNNCELLFLTANSWYTLPVFVLYIYYILYICIIHVFIYSSYPSGAWGICSIGEINPFPVEILYIFLEEIIHKYILPEKITYTMWYK